MILLLMVMVFIFRIFYIYSNAGLHLSHVQGRDRTSAYIGAAGYQSISDLTQPTQPTNHEIAQRPDQHTGNSTPYSLR